MSSLFSLQICTTESVSFKSGEDEVVIYMMTICVAYLVRNINKKVFKAANIFVFIGLPEIIAIRVSNLKLNTSTYKQKL